MSTQECGLSDVTDQNFAGIARSSRGTTNAANEKVICSSACQNQAKVRRNEIRNILGTEVTHAIIFK
jgi:hypothetical protein